MVAQVCEHTKNCRIVHLTWVNYTERELHLMEAVKDQKVG